MLYVIKYLPVMLKCNHFQGFFYVLIFVVMGWCEGWSQNYELKMKQEWKVRSLVRCADLNLRRFAPQNFFKHVIN